MRFGLFGGVAAPRLPDVAATAQSLFDFVETNVEAEALGEDGRLIVAFTTQVVRDATPDEATFATMSARFTTAQITQLLLVIGQYMMVARVMATAAGVRAIRASRQHRRCCDPAEANPAHGGP